jgi:micrococcal nuclease
MKKKQISSLLSAIVALIIIFLGGNELVKNNSKADVITSGPFDESQVLVVEVVDGDTIKVQDEQSKVVKTVRLIGINTPETKDPRKPVEYYGKEASAYAKDLLANRKVTLVKDVEDLDKYNRLLRYIYLGDGTFVNEQMVRQGYAQIMTIAPNVKYSELFLAAEKDARENKRGMWGG